MVVGGCMKGHDMRVYLEQCAPQQVLDVIGLGVGNWDVL